MQVKSNTDLLPHFNLSMDGLLRMAMRKVDEGGGTRRYHSFQYPRNPGVKCVLPRGRCSFIIHKAANGWAYCVNLQAIGLDQVRVRGVSLKQALRDVDSIYANI